MTTESLAAKTGQLFYLSKEALKRRQIDEIWKTKRATAPKSLAAVVMSSAVIECVRKELRRSTGQNVTVEEIGRLLEKTVLKSECFG